MVTGTRKIEEERLHIKKQKEELLKSLSNSNELRPSSSKSSHYRSYEDSCQSRYVPNIYRDSSYRSVEDSAKYMKGSGASRKFDKSPR